MPFNQPSPELDNQYRNDRVLRSYLARALPSDMQRDVESSLSEMGEITAGQLYRLQLNEHNSEPRLITWDAWGNRVDRIEITALWKVAEQIAATHGVVATAYEGRHGRYSRIHQFALAYLFTPSAGLYSCPLAMTDGAARTLIISENRSLITRAVTRLTSRDPDIFWTSGQWMTESIGGSDVGLAETTARRDPNGNWRLYGHKWFASAANAPMALALARPEGNRLGGRGLALFYVETRDSEGQLQNVYIHRLKDKLGTRQVPTAELTLDGTPALLVSAETDGVRQIGPMLNLTRAWNSVSSVAYMRRGLALARDYAHKRSAFGSLLAEKPLHRETLAGLQAEMEAAFHLTFYLIEWIGRDEAERLSEKEMALIRLLTPIVKLTTGRQAVAVASEILEAFGGAGYVEDTGLPMLLRDSQVFPIWEGTTNILALETLRALRTEEAMNLFQQEIQGCIHVIQDTRLSPMVQSIQKTLTHIEVWLAQSDPVLLEAGARALGLTLGRTLALALVSRQAQWSLDHESDVRPILAARRFCDAGIDLIRDQDIDAAQALALDAL